jgi:hypothetical protein
MDITASAQPNCAEAREAVHRALAITASRGITWWDAELHRIRAAEYLGRE